MSYNCTLCKSHVPPNTPMLKHIAYRTNKAGHQEIDREIPVCGSCLWAIKEGVPLHKLIRSEPRPIPTETVSIARTYYQGRPKQLQTYENVTVSQPVIEKNPKKRDRRSQFVISERPSEDDIRCEVCGEPIGDDGQITAEGVLCPKHLVKRK